MARGNEHSGNSTADGDDVEVELEALRKDDFSWHPCKVSLCSTGVGLMVEYSNDESVPDDMILSTEEAVARLRIRSTPLEGVTCCTIQPGDRVLAKRNHVNLFFDAEVIEVMRVRHSKKIHCRCTFMVKWIHNGLEGETAIIRSSALMKMSPESVHLHPTVFAFFNILLTSSCSDVSPIRALAEGMECEMDINELEKQIEKISNSADASRMEITEKVLSEEVEVREQSHCNLIPASEVCDTYIQLPPFQDCTEGSAGQSQLALSIEMEFKHPPPPSPFTREMFSEGRSPCNPIAACAALASLMSKSSESSKPLSVQKDVKEYVPPPNITNNPIVSFINNSSKVNDEYSLGTEAGTVTHVPKSGSIVKELFPTKKLTKEPQTFDASTEVSKWESRNEKSSQEVSSCVGKYVCSTTKKKMVLPARSSSAVKRSSGGNVETPLSSARRLTRSGVRPIRENQTVKTKEVTQEILSTTMEQNPSVQKTDILPDKETVTSVIDNESGLTISEKFKNHTEKMGTCEKKKHAMRINGTGMQTAINNSKRLTRSSVKQRSEKNNGEPPEGLEECSFPGHPKSDLEGYITSKRKAPEMEKEISLSPVHETCLNPTAEEYDKMQSSASIKTAQKPEDDATSNVSRSQGVKSKSNASKKQEVRSSPRLRFLPRTRSQTRS